MVGLLLAGAAVAAGAAVGVGAIGLGVAAASRIGSAYGKTVEQMYEQQRLNDYYYQQSYNQQSYNQQPYYRHSGGSHHRYYEPSGYYSGYR